MNVKQAMISSRVADNKMTVRELFEECALANLPGLPFRDDQGRIVGRVTLKNVLKQSCLPEYMVELAHVLGERFSHMEDMCADIIHLLDKPVTPFVQEPHLSLRSDSTAVKALAMMEQSDTSYIFVVDQGHYLGAVTIHSLASTLAVADELYK
jgi:predicted transcriptional regulator